MKKRIYLAVTFTILILSVLLMSCGGAKTTTTSQATTQATTTTTTTTSSTKTTTAAAATTTTTTSKLATTTTTTSNPATTETLGDILGRSAGTASVKYEMVMTNPGESPFTQKIWIKQNKMRTEMTVEGETTIMLVDWGAKVMYTYMPSQNMAIKMTLNDTAPVPATEEAQSVEDYSPTIIGTETVDGKVCLVVEYAAEGAATKMWIWKDKGFPIKVEVTTTEGKSVIEYKNYDFDDIADSMFELPAGVQIIAM